jgi:type IV pilus assembly protein PilO
MAKFTELPQVAQVGIAAAVCVALFVGSYYMFTKPILDGNEKDAAVLAQKKSEIAQLAPYEAKVQELDRQLQSLNQQLELQKRIVPDEKEVPNFITLVQGEAQKSGVEIRRYSSKPTSTKEFYSEVPFELDIDGPYYGVLVFYQRIGQLERIVNVSNVAMASVTNAGAAKVKRTYTYNPTETVVASFMATTFYSVSTPPPAATPAKK